VYSHVIIDIIGYYVPPQATPLSCVRENTSFSALPSVRTSQFGTACRTGYTLTGTGCYSVSDDVYISSTSGYGTTSTAGNTSGGTAFCTARNYGAAAATVYQDTFCCKVPGRSTHAWCGLRHQCASSGAVEVKLLFFAPEITQPRRERHARRGSGWRDYRMRGAGNRSAVQRSGLVTRQLREPKMSAILWSLAAISA
jgi:hypothetical protein